MSQPKDYVIRRYEIATQDLRTNEVWYEHGLLENIILTQEEYEQLGKPKTINAVIRGVGGET